MTSPSHRRVLATMTGAVAVLLLSAVGAWACTSSAQISLGYNNGQPGATVSVTGEEFVSGGTVEVYWEPNQGERQLLFEATGPSFAQNITIPEDAPAGTHLIDATGYDDENENEVRGNATAAFTVPHGAVAGQVTDDAEGEGVHAAEVTVSHNGQVVGSDTTNAEGHFRVERLERGEHEVAVDRDYYQRSTAHTNVDLGETSQLNFDLAREPQDEPEPSGSDGSDGGDPEGSEGAEPQGSEGATEPEGSEGAEPEGSEGATEPEGSEPATGETGDEQASEETAEQPEAGEQPTDGTADQRETDEPGQQEQPAPSGDEPVSQPQPAEPVQEGTGREAAGDEPAEPTTAEEPAGAGDAAEAAETAEPALATAAERRGRVPASEAEFDPQATAPSARTSAADLWSGLEAGSEAAMTDAQGGETGSGPAGVGQQLAIAVGLLGAGLLLLAGVGVVAVRRQRTPATAERPSA